MGNKLDEQYVGLVREISEQGVRKQDRTGTGTLSLFGKQVRHNMRDGFPLLTTKFIHFNSVKTELMWFLKGDTNIQYLVKNNCNIWNGDCYKRYYTTRKNELIRLTTTYPDMKTESYIYSQQEFIEQIKTNDTFAEKWGDLGPIYGKQWRKWDTYEQFRMKDLDGNRYYGKKQSIDQLQNSIDLLISDPDSRRNKVSAWNVGELDQMVLPPCHTDFQFYTRELSINDREMYWRNNMGMKDIQYMLYSLDGEEGLHKEYDKQNVPRRAISLMWNQRSCDIGLGLPFNIASYGLLLEMIAKQVNMISDELIGNLGDTHLYLDHVEPIKEQLDREPYALPQIKLVGSVNDIVNYELHDILLENYKYHPKINLPLSN